MLQEPAQPGLNNSQLGSKTSQVCSAISPSSSLLFCACLGSLFPCSDSPSVLWWFSLPSAEDSDWSESSPLTPCSTSTPLLPTFSCKSRAHPTPWNPFLFPLNASPRYSRSCCQTFLVIMVWPCFLLRPFPLRQLTSTHLGTSSWLGILHLPARSWNFTLVFPLCGCKFTLQPVANEFFFLLPQCPAL